MEQAQTIARRGMLIVLSSPSGAGKSTLTRNYLAMDRGVQLSISVTTRPPRPGEVEGTHYYFISEEDFQHRSESGELLEWAHVFGHAYGTPAQPVLAALEKGQDFIFDLDWQGTQQLAARYPEDMVRVFILPPDAAQLQQRLVNRAQDSREVIAGRMAKAGEELSHWPEYDYVIVNEDVDTALDDLAAIIRAERLKRQRRVGLSGFIRDLQSKLAI